MILQILSFQLFYLCIHQKVVKITTVCMKNFVNFFAVLKLAEQFIKGGQLRYQLEDDVQYYSLATRLPSSAG